MFTQLALQGMLLLSLLLYTCKRTGKIPYVNVRQESKPAQFAALQASVAAINAAPPPAAATPPPIPPSAPALVKVVRELDLQASKKTNIVLSGIAPSLLTDADIVTNLLRDELGITANVTRCTRLGKPRADGDRDTRPRLLLVTLSSADTANDVIRAATKLRRSD
jgi:hypothetical protein